MPLLAINDVDRAKPKSAIFEWHSELMRMFDGFKSLCISSPECINLRAFKI